MQGPRVEVSFSKSGALHCARAGQLSIKWVLSSGSGPHSLQIGLSGCDSGETELHAFQPICASGELDFDKYFPSVYGVCCR